MAKGLKMFLAGSESLDREATLAGPRVARCNCKTSGVLDFGLQNKISFVNSLLPAWSKKNVKEGGEKLLAGPQVRPVRTIKSLAGPRSRNCT